jgi:hypothetical protein
MATWYVDSTATGGTGAGTSWTNACLTMAAAITLSAAGDDFNVYNAHAETQASAPTLTFKGTAAAPNRVFSCNRTNSPAQDSDLLAGAAITTTGAFGITITGFAYIYGVTLNVGTGTTLAVLTLVSTVASDLTFENCTLKSPITTANSIWAVGAAVNSGSSRVTFINTTVSFNGGVSCGLNSAGGTFYWKNTASAIGGTQTAIANFLSASRVSVFILDGVDLSFIASGKNIVGALTGSAVVQLKNCRLASGALFATPSAAGCFVDVINCDSGATGYRHERHMYQGVQTVSTSVNNGASDGVQVQSWQIITTANANRQSPFECFEIIQWVAPGTYANTLVNVTSATASLTNADVWVEAQVLDNASFPISDLYSSGPATQLTTGTTLTAGSAWTVPLGGSPSNYVLNVPSFTVAIAGYVRFTVKVGKASQTLYVDPKVVVA